jgi:hypothetical protein
MGRKRSRARRGRRPLRQDGGLARPRAAAARADARAYRRRYGLDERPRGGAPGPRGNRDGAALGMAPSHHGAVGAIVVVVGPGGSVARRLRILLRTRAGPASPRVGGRRRRRRDEDRSTPRDPCVAAAGARRRSRHHRQYPPTDRRGGRGRFARGSIRRPAATRRARACNARGFRRWNREAVGRNLDDATPPSGDAVGHELHDSAAHVDADVHPRVDGRGPDRGPVRCFADALGRAGATSSPPALHPHRESRQTLTGSSRCRPRRHR